MLFIEKKERFTHTNKLYSYGYASTYLSTMSNKKGHKTRCFVFPSHMMHDIRLTWHFCYIYTLPTDPLTSAMLMIYHHGE